jgi:hypothetical protein
LPTPPFWFAIARTLPMTLVKLRRGAVGTGAARYEPSGRFTAMPGRRGNRAGVGAILR